MPRQLFSDNAQTTLAADFGRFDATFTVETGDGDLFQSPTNGDWEAITITDGTYLEVIKVSGRTGDVFTVYPGSRGYFWGYSDLSWVSGATVYGGIPAGMLRFMPGQADTPPEWAPNTSYQPNSLVLNTAATKVFVLNNGTAKTSGGSEPTWNTSIGDDTTDNTATWVCVGNYTGASSDGIQFGQYANAYNSYAMAIGDYSAAHWGITLGYLSHSGYYGICVGRDSRLSSDTCIGIGHDGDMSPGAGYGNWYLGHNVVMPGSATYCGVLGTDGSNSIDGTIAQVGAPIIGKSSKADASSQEYYLAGNLAVYSSIEVDLKTVADDAITITISTGSTFFPMECRLVITEADTVTVQPFVSLGISGGGNTEVLLASTQTSGLTAAKHSKRFTTLATETGQTSLTVSVKTGATATTMKGRFFWVGILVEDET